MKKSIYVTMPSLAPLDEFTELLVYGKEVFLPIMGH